MTKRRVPSIAASLFFALSPCMLLAGSDDCPNPDRAGPVVKITSDDAAMYMNPASLVWNGTGYGVAWNDVREGTEEIYFAILDADGNRLSPEIRVSDTVPLCAPDAGVCFGRGPSLSWTGSEYGLAWWSGDSLNKQVYFARIDSTGQPIGNVLNISAEPAEDRWPDLVWTGEAFGMVWFEEIQQDHRLIFALVDPEEGRVGPGKRVTSGGNSAYPVMVWTGDEFGVGWTDNSFAEPPIQEWRFARLDAFGNKKAADTIYAGPGPAFAAALTWTGSAYQLLWSQFDSTGEVRLTQLDSEGFEVSETNVTTPVETLVSLSAAWTGSELGVVGWDTSEHQLYLVRFDGNGQFLPPVRRLNHDGELHTAPAVVWTGAGYGLVWKRREPDFSPFTTELVFSRIACDCVDTDGDGMTVCRDCDDENPTIYPGAPQRCEGQNNNCLDPDWPLPPVDGGDADGDGTPLLCDNCPTISNDQSDLDGDGFGDACDACHNDALDDHDQDSLCADVDNCPFVANPAQEDFDGDGVGDYCDNCPVDANPDQINSDFDSSGDACDYCLDTDRDGFGDPEFDQGCAIDNCPTLYNPAQADDDGDGFGNACDICPLVANPEQTDQDGDNIGDACDCEPLLANTYAGAPEINDGGDNQCPGDIGFGLVDETSTELAFTQADQLSWPNQLLARVNEVARSPNADMASGCESWTTPENFASDPTVPVAGDVIYYIARSLEPNPGSWGTDSSGVERSLTCTNIPVP